MTGILNVVLPVFLVIGAGYFAALFRLFSSKHVDGLMSFAQTFAIPCLLFSAISTLDLGQDFEASLLGTYYTGSTIVFLAGALVARFIFRRPGPDAVAIGFACFFGNSLLLGLAITEQAYGPTALAPNYAIIAIHSPFCYIVGITAMEIVRASGGGVLHIFAQVLRAVFSNSLMIGIGLGFVVNLSGFPMPSVATQAIDLIAQAALPAALFAMGGVMLQYRPEGDLKEVALICIFALIIHPTIVWSLAHSVVDLSNAQMRGAIITAAMAPGANAYVFASMYGVAKRVAATSVLLGTAVSILTASAWLSVLP